jgi:hypothetical protein
MFFCGGLIVQYTVVMVIVWATNSARYWIGAKPPDLTTLTLLGN